MARTDRMTPMEFRLMEAIGGNERMLGGLAADLGRTPEGTAQTAASLVRKGWAERVHRTDRVGYRLTRTGRAKLRDLTGEGAKT